MIAVERRLGEKGEKNVDYIAVWMGGFVCGSLFERWARWRLMRKDRKRQKRTKPDSW
jgi:hypothetical protein